MMKFSLDWLQGWISIKIWWFNSILDHNSHFQLELLKIEYSDVCEMNIRFFFLWQALFHVNTSDDSG